MIETTILDKIIDNKRKEVEYLKSQKSIEAIKRESSEVENAIDIFNLLINSKNVNIIAEIKKASPSKGVIRTDFDPLTIAKSFERAGAAAISTLTDERFFQGKLSYLSDIRKIVDLPLLRKDFIIDPYQVYESRLAGADFILLIVSALDATLIKELLDLSHEQGLNAIVEVHDELEMETALDIGSRIIGINNRNLKTFEVSLDVAVRLSKMVDGNRVVISESGINSHEDINMLRSYGINSFLIGEKFMESADPGKDLLNLLENCN